MKKWILGLAVVMMAAVARAATVTLDWDAVTTNADGTPLTDLQGYRLFRSTASLTSMTTAQATASGIVTKTGLGIATTTAVNGLNDGTSYYFRLTAFDANGNQSGFNEFPDEVVAFTLPLAVPSAPGNFRATVLPTSQHTVFLNWTDSDTETSYEVERSTVSAAGPFTRSYSWPADVTGERDFSLISNTTHYYRMRAVNASGSSVFVSTSVVTPDWLPIQPAGFQAGAVQSDRVTLVWEDWSNNEIFFDVRYSQAQNFAPETQLSTGANATSMVVTNLTPDTTYYFRARTCGGAGCSSFAPALTARTLIAPPAVPGALSLTALSSSQIRLNWADVSGETSYRLERSLDNVTFITAATLPANATTHTDGGLAASTFYTYRLVAKNAGGESVSHPSGGSTLAGAASPPATPASLTPVVVSSTQVHLSWSDVANEDGYRVEWSPHAGFSPVHFATVTLDVTNRAIPNLVAGTTYYFRVRAFNAAGDSGFSPAASARTNGGGVVLPEGFNVPPGLKAAYAFPNPAVGADPVIRAMMGGVDSVEITIFDQAGRVVHTARTSQTSSVRGETAFEYRWAGEKASGVYYAVIHGKKGDETIRARAKFAVLR